MPLLIGDPLQRMRLGSTEMKWSWEHYMYMNCDNLAIKKLLCPCFVL